MRISVKPFLENLKSVSNVVSDFVYIDCADENNHAFYVSTDTQAMKIPLDITNILDNEKKVYVINKSEFLHIISYAKEDMLLNSEYEYNVNDVFKGKFSKNEDYADELPSRKVLFDNENEYTMFMEVTPSILKGISSGSIFVEPDSIKASERFLDIQNSKVFSYSSFRIYMDNIAVEGEGILSNEVIKSIESMGAGAIVLRNKMSYLITNAQRSIFEYFSIPNDVDIHPLFSEKFQNSLNKTKGFNAITFNVDEFKSKLEYISFYCNKTKNHMCFLKATDSEFSLSIDESMVSFSAEMRKTEEFDEMSVPLDSSTLQLIVSKIGKDCEKLTMYVSSETSNKLVMFVFGDSDETVVMSKINV
jgi:hypothetical protein